ncbi:MAG: precorrin-6A synthase (deacetylating) [Propionibacteriaceae bacterium]|nr:precorrin-6A synthase (deacetylating) [Propionibacteriaceae bacterium]
MITALVIGIGTGSPGHLTQEAVAALNRVDVFLVADKGPDKEDLVALRNEICRTFITGHQYRMVEVPDPVRGPDRDRDAGAYRAGVDLWHRRRADSYADIIQAELGGGGTVGFLVWGDPALYDSTIRIVQLMQESAGFPIELSVIPGISSLQVLAARHQIVLNRVGQPIHITTGRRLVAEYDPVLGDVLVMLDGDLACAQLLEDHPDLRIFWGAQLGLPDETLISGRLDEVIDDIRRTRTAIRQHRGWVMDTYLLRPSEM